MFDNLENYWHIAALRSELEPNAVLGRTLLGRDIALFRTASGQVGAIENLCPHRFAPLHLGFVEGEALRCGYHGLGFDRQGVCAINPQGPAPVGPARRHHYVTFERDDHIWIWLGAPEQADVGKIPPLPFFQEVEPSVICSDRLLVRSNFELLNDNILDLSHSDFLHASTLSGERSKVKPVVAETGDGFRISWVSHQNQPPPLYRPYVGEHTPVVNVTSVDWWPIGVMYLEVNVTPAAGGQTVGTRNLHAMTPETDSTTHYFYSVSRTFGIDDATLTEQGAELARRIFTQEDIPMIEAVQARLGPGHDLLRNPIRPLSLPSDAGGVKARLILQRIRKVAAGSDES